jgi:DNA repair exonuclease SbcCD ATPase subunit
MIKFTELRWSNAFSYGKNNVLKLDEAPLTQLVGKNGNGKSSIALVIEEVLFNQNSKKIKKADILNRYTKDKNYTIELDFDKDGTEYTVSTTRTVSSGSVTLTRDGKDISSHTSTGTYKTIEHILGYDFKTFSQIVYQSSISSLEFLTATDTARKKFLIELLNLTKYTEASEVFKDLASSMSKQVDVVQAKMQTVSAWLTKYKGESLVEKPLKDELDYPTSILERVTLLSNELANIEVTNKKISQNNAYKQIFEGIVLETSYSQPDSSQLMPMKLQVAQAQKELKDGLHLSTKHRGPVIKCVTCHQDMDNSTMYNMVLDFDAKRQSLEELVSNLTIKIKGLETAISKYAAHEKTTQEWEKYHALIDKIMTSELLDRDQLTVDIKSLQSMASEIIKTIDATKRANKIAAEHNSKVKVILEQLASMEAEFKELSEELTIRISELSNLQILVKSFSTTGLVAYKIECLVKDLEEITNEYLTILSSGRFQLGFKITASDKLNVVITDNGRDIDIVALSTGERARVNVATLLAIRKLMQSLSNSRTNLLILDETVENLDAEGKEKLIEVLLEEQSLNTFLISHGFSHPLLEKVGIVKDNNISRIE